MFSFFLPCDTGAVVSFEIVVSSHSRVFGDKEISTSARRDKAELNSISLFPFGRGWALTEAALTSGRQRDRQPEAISRLDRHTLIVCPNNTRRFRPHHCSGTKACMTFRIVFTPDSICHLFAKRIAHLGPPTISQLPMSSPHGACDSPLTVMVVRQRRLIEPFENFEPVSHAGRVSSRQTRRRLSRVGLP